MLFALLFAAPASAQSTPGYTWPNSVLGVTAGTPTTLGLRGEQWLSDDVEGELGVGVQSFESFDPTFDWALRWRPDFACFGCGSRALVTIGIGPGGTVVPPPAFDGPWGFAVGADLGVNLIVWTGPSVGVNVSGRGGGGVAWTGTDFSALGGTGWVMGTLGLAF
jgi:hypothetical protein